MITMCFYFYFSNSILFLDFFQYYLVLVFLFVDITIDKCMNC